MEAVVHYIKNGRGFGPISVQDFLDLFDSGVIAMSDLARVEGASSWEPAQDIANKLRAGTLVVPIKPSGSLRPASGMPPGGHTVFTSAPPIPQLRVPREALSAPVSATAQRCPKCNGSANAGAGFCKHCGHVLRPRPCEACSFANDADALFCASCGKRLGSLAPPPRR